MALMYKCGGCDPKTDANFKKMFPNAELPPVQHCNGRADRVTPGVLGGYVCTCPCRLSPHDIWKQIEQTPGTREDHRETYLARMVEAGHVIHREKGDTAPLFECGYDPRKRYAE